MRNRVSPTGDIVDTPERGKLMGNRGILHDHNQVVQKRWAHQQWIICLLQFNGRKRSIMAPNCYTELFFLDEATALAAGHRPCGECQRDNYRQFKALFEHHHQRKMRSADIDRQLHKERLMWVKGKRTKQKRTVAADLHTLPDYTFVLHNDQPHLWLASTLHLWSFAGYTSTITPLPQQVDVLTPPSTVAVLRSGYVLQH